MIGKRKKNTQTNSEMEAKSTMSHQNDETIQVEGSESDAVENQQGSSGEIKNDELAILKQEIEEQRDKYLRLFADFDNYRKRTIKEKLELSKTASEDTIVALLPVLDDLGRALKNMDDTEEIKPVKDGIVLIYNKFNNILGLKGLEPINALGKTFDTDFHDAIAQVPVEDQEQKGKVIDETEKGYTLNGKVIRHSKVAVGQ